MKLTLLRANPVLRTRSRSNFWTRQVVWSRPHFIYKPVRLSPALASLPLFVPAHSTPLALKLAFSNNNRLIPPVLNYGFLLLLRSYSTMLCSYSSYCYALRGLLWFALGSSHNQSLYASKFYLKSTAHQRGRSASILLASLKRKLL